MIKIYTFYSCIFLITLFSGNVFSQTKSDIKKGTASAKTIKPGAVVKGKVQPVKAERSVVSPVKPSDVTNQAVTNTIEIPVAKTETVFEPKPNLSASLYAESLPAMDPGKNEDLMPSPIIILYPADKEQSALFAEVKSIAFADKFLPNSKLIMDVTNKDTLALVINSYKVARSLQDNKNLMALTTYVFFGAGQLKESNDPYIKDLEKKKYLLKMIALQNQNVVPREAKVLESTDQIESR
jgi:hypothetical protein